MMRYVDRSAVFIEGEPTPSYQPSSSRKRKRGQKEEGEENEEEGDGEKEEEKKEENTDLSSSSLPPPLPFPSYFARTKLDQIIIFVDPEELSYHNFENIIPLDRPYFSQLSSSPSSPPPPTKPELNFWFSDVEEVGKEGVYLGKLAGGREGMKGLKGLDDLGLYSTVLNREMRGGSRFIFHSVMLSDALTSAIEYSFKNSSSFGSIFENFSFVNYVFRLNKFEMGEKKFSSHLDTPYYDARRRHISRYTILIYLTGGEGTTEQPCLRIEEKKIEKVEEMTCVIFDQKYEHEGFPYANKNKIFIRSELIFEEKELEHCPKIGSIFSKAVYLTGQSIFDKELSKYSQSCYDRVASLHWNCSKNSQDIEKDEEKQNNEEQQQQWWGNKILLKKFKGVEFYTNGYDYFFSPGSDIKKAAVLTILDYFNCKLDKKSFRKMCDTTMVEKMGWGEGRVRELKEGGKGWEIFKEGRGLVELDGESDEDSCCPFHCPYEPMWVGDFQDFMDEFEDEDKPNIFRPENNHEVRELFRGCQLFAKEKYLKSAMFVLLGEEVFLFEDRIQIVGDKIYLSFHSGSPIPPLNFASCWNIEPEGVYSFISLLGSAPGNGGSHPPAHVYTFNLPPILFSHSSPSSPLHLMFDFFENDWTVGWGGGEEEGEGGEKVLLPMLQYGGSSFINAVGGEEKEDEFTFNKSAKEYKEWLEPEEEEEWGKNIKKAR